MNAASSQNASKPNPALCKLFAQYFLRDRELKPFIEWAGQQLVEGRDTPSLRILAGLSGDDSQETEFYLKRAFRELALCWPDEKVCLLQLCAEIAREVTAGKLAAIEGYNRIYQIARHLDYPCELNRWIRLEIEFFAQEGAADEQEQMAKCVVKEAVRFLALMEDYERTGVFRLTTQNSFKRIRDWGWDVPKEAAALATKMPSGTDEELSLSFFRTTVSNEQFDYLTIPRTFFGRSEIKSVTFEYSDLSESRMCWNDWQHCQFAGANLSGCDLRRSVFECCYFNRADLTGADLRGASFVKCLFSGASMKGARLEKQFGLSRRLKAKALKLSPEQVHEIAWTTGVGEEPPGG